MSIHIDADEVMGFGILAAIVALLCIPVWMVVDEWRHPCIASHVEHIYHPAVEDSIRPSFGAGDPFNIGGGIARDPGHAAYTEHRTVCDERKP